MEVNSLFQVSTLRAHHFCLNVCTRLRRLVRIPIAVTIAVVVLASARVCVVPYHLQAAT